LRQLKHLKTIDLSGSSLEKMDEFAADVANGTTAAPPGTRVIIEGYNTQHV
jgi:ribosomal protein L6P/L9E